MEREKEGLVATVRCLIRGVQVVLEAPKRVPEVGTRPAGKNAKVFRYRKPITTPAIDSYLYGSQSDDNSRATFMDPCPDIPIRPGNVRLD